MTSNQPIDVDSLRLELSDYARRSFDRGLICGTGGNLSVRVPGTDTVLITPTGLSLGDAKPEEHILVNLEGEIVHSPLSLKPSKETSFHLSAYRIRPDVQALAHLHPPYATAYAVKQRDIPMVTDAGFKQPPMPRVPFAPSGSQDLQENVARVIKENPECKVLLMEQHGIAALGTDAVSAYNLADLTEELACIAYLWQRL